MTTKEKIIRDSIKQVEKKLSNLMELWDTNPLSDVLRLRQQSAERGILNIPLEEINQLVKEEKRLFALAEKQSKMQTKLPQIRVQLEKELSDLRAELYWIEQRKSKEAA